MRVDTVLMRQSESELADTLECARFPGEHAAEEAADAVSCARDWMREAADEIDRLREQALHLTDDTGETWEAQCMRLRERVRELEAEMARLEKRIWPNGERA